MKHGGWSGVIEKSIGMIIIKLCDKDKASGVNELWGKYMDENDLVVG